MNDRSITHLAALGIVAAILLAVVFVGAAALLGKAIPEVLPTIVRDGLIGLLGLLAKGPWEKSEVVVANTPTEPVPTRDTTVSDTPASSPARRRTR